MVGAVVATRRLVVRRRRPEVLEAVPSADDEHAAAASGRGGGCDGRQCRRDRSVAMPAGGDRRRHGWPGESGVPPRSASAARVHRRRRRLRQRPTEVHRSEKPHVTGVTIE